MSDQLSLVARAESLSRQEDWPRAAAAWQAVVDLNPVNGVFWDRLGQARFAIGDHAGALAAYRQAEALGVWPVRGPDPVPLASIFPGEISYRTACCHALLGDADDALAALARAVDQGLRDPGRAATDPDLASLRDDPLFRDLAGVPGARDLPGTPGVRDLPGTPGGDRTSRVGGWRADLRVLRREIERRVPFRDVVDAGFAAAAEDLDRAIPDLDDARIVVGMWRLLRRLGDGHARLDTAEAFPEWERCLPVWFYFFDEGLFLPQVDPRYRGLLGARVLAFDGRPTARVVDALDPMSTRDNDYGPLGTVPVWMRRPVFLHAVGVADHPGEVTLTVRLPDGGVTDVTVAAEPSPRPGAWPERRPPGAVRVTDGADGQVPAYLRDVDNPYWFERLPAANVVYFQFNAVTDKPEEPLAAFYRRMFTTVDEHGAALVVDLRWNGGGNTFLAQPLVHELIRRDQLTLFVIVGRATFSAAQNTATLLDRHTRAVFVGEPTGSSPNFVGETAPFHLPHSGVRANVSDLYWQTSWPFDRRTAIAPDIYAPPTFAAYRRNRDPAMDAILDHLGSDRPMGERAGHDEEQGDGECAGHDEKQDDVERAGHDEKQDDGHEAVGEHDDPGVRAEPPAPT